MGLHTGKWLEQLRVDPLPVLLESGNAALQYFARRDLLQEKAGPVEELWDLPAALKLLRKQQDNGSWRYPGKNRAVYPETNYDLLETFRSLGQLVQKHGLNREHPAISRAAEIPWPETSPIATPSFF